MVLGGAAAGAAVGAAALLILTPWLRAHPTALAAPSAPQPAVVQRSAGISPSEDPASTSTTLPPVELTDLEELLREQTTGLPGLARVHVRTETSEAGIDAETPVAAASVIKLGIMAAVEDAWNTGFLTRTPEDVERLRKMITESENAAADALLERVGTQQTNSWLQDHGFSGIVINRKMADEINPSPGQTPNMVTASDVTRLLQQIEDGQVVSAKASAQMRALLLAQTRRGRIPSGIPQEAEGVKVGNKTGSLPGLQADAAFVELTGARRYELAVFLTNVGDGAGS